ncbi:PREDICTED: uncharacterized protein C19orf47 homolog isoform X3 [Gekko japonicus]|uniref:Uncharacterized protein C19orf47 homolog isoform X3 n=1 Tax=Gekko japonicus TaxID=146911 RepID=A0ABM1JNW4_GEKJA|nr:PREDICTED: uncharacterized protein C19orf47 homolog isoform X3 [Gekko japonicus]
MVSVTMATSEWIQFFKEAGIPPGPAVNYAVMFVDNRIQKNMLMDLNKEILNELGVTVVGDIIAILKHAKVVYRQEMCKAATESVASSQATVQPELRRNAASAASRMIANSLSRDSPPSTPVRRPDSSASKISVTVSNKLAVKNAKTGLPRTSVFDRLGAETNADTTTGAKPTGVFSRLGDMQEAAEDKAAESEEDDSSVLPYAGVLKKSFRPPAPKEEGAPAGVTVKAKATSSKSQPPPAGKSPASSGGPRKEKALESPSRGQVARRLGKRSLPGDPQDSSVTSSRSRPEPDLQVTIQRTLGSAKVSSTSEGHSAQMDNTGTVSVFKRLGRRTVV